MKSQHLHLMSAGSRLEHIEEEKRGSKYWQQIFDCIAVWSPDSEVCAQTHSAQIWADSHAYTPKRHLTIMRYQGLQLSLTWKRGCSINTLTHTHTLSSGPATRWDKYTLYGGQWFVSVSLSCALFLTGFIPAVRTVTRTRLGASTCTQIL